MTKYGFLVITAGESWFFSFFWNVTFAVIEDIVGGARFMVIATFEI